MKKLKFYRNFRENLEKTLEICIWKYTELLEASEIIKNLVEKSMEPANF